MTVEQLKNVFRLKGYKWDPLINVIGIRNGATGRKVTNKFDDFITIAYFKDNAWNLVVYKCTTDAGTYYVKKKLLNPKGVGILKEGQYVNTHAIRLHQGKYEALCQTYGSVKVYRDANKDDFYDLLVVDEGNFGVNIHCAGENSENVDNWSALCTVLKMKRDFKEFMKIVNSYKVVKKNAFSYTLINTNDLV